MLDERTVAETITPGTDVVLSALRVPPRQRDVSFTLRRGVANIISAMRAAETRRVLAVSASALYVDSYDNLLLRMAKPVLQLLFANMYDDVRAMDSELGAAECDWTIVVAPQLNNKPPTGSYRTAIGHNLSRAAAHRAHELRAVDVGQVLTPAMMHTRRRCGGAARSTRRHSGSCRRGC